MRWHASRAVSSSCSYASAAISRTLFKKGAAFIPSLAFLFASTNLAIELGIILYLLMGWQFTAAEPVLHELLSPYGAPGYCRAGPATRRGGAGDRAGFDDLRPGFPTAWPHPASFHADDRD